MRLRCLDSVDRVLAYLMENPSVKELHLTPEEFIGIRQDIVLNHGNGPVPRPADLKDKYAGQIFGIPMYIDEEPFFRMAREVVEEEERKLRVITGG